MKKWGIIIAVVIVLAIFGALLPDKEPVTTDNNNKSGAGITVDEIKEVTPEQFKEFYNEAWKDYSFAKMQDFNKDEVNEETLKEIKSNIESFKIDLNNINTYDDANLKELKSEILSVMTQIELKADKYLAYTKKNNRADLEAYKIASEKIEEKEKELIELRDKLLNKYDCKIDSNGLITE